MPDDEVEPTRVLQDPPVFPTTRTPKRLTSFRSLFFLLLC